MATKKQSRPIVEGLANPRGVTAVYGTPIDWGSLPEKIRIGRRIANGRFKLEAHYPAKHFNDKKEYIDKRKAGSYCRFYDKKSPFFIARTVWDGTSQPGMHMVVKNRNETYRFLLTPKANDPTEATVIGAYLVHREDGVPVLCSGPIGELKAVGDDGDFKVTAYKKHGIRCPKKDSSGKDLAGEIPKTFGYIKRTSKKGPRKTAKDYCKPSHTFKHPTDIKRAEVVEEMDAYMDEQCTCLMCNWSGAYSDLTFLDDTPEGGPPGMDFMLVCPSCGDGDWLDDMMAEGYDEPCFSCDGIGTWDDGDCEYCQGSGMMSDTLRAEMAIYNSEYFDADCGCFKKAEETLVWKDKTLSFMDWAKQEEASHLKKYGAESLSSGGEAIQSMADTFEAKYSKKDVVADADYEKVVVLFDVSGSIGRPDATGSHQAGWGWFTENSLLNQIQRRWAHEDIDFISFGSHARNVDAPHRKNPKDIPSYHGWDVSGSEGGTRPELGLNMMEENFEREFGTDRPATLLYILSDGAFNFQDILPFLEKPWLEQVAIVFMEAVNQPGALRGAVTNMEAALKTQGSDVQKKVQVIAISPTLVVHPGGSVRYDMGPNRILFAESFEAPYAGAGATMDIGKDTALSSFTPEELTTSSAIHGDFDQASLDYSGHQNIEVRAEGWGKTCQVEDRDTDEPCTAPATVNLQDILMEYEVGEDPYEKMHLGDINEFFCKKHYDEMDDMWAEGSEHQNIEVRAETRPFQRGPEDPTEADECGGTACPECGLCDCQGDSNPCCESFSAEDDVDWENLTADERIQLLHDAGYPTGYSNPPTWAKPLGYVGALAAGWISASMIDKAKE
jgi:hypothetical protein